MKNKLVNGKVAVGGVKKAKAGSGFYQAGTGRRNSVENAIIGFRKWDLATKNRVLKFISKFN